MAKKHHKYTHTTITHHDDGSHTVKHHHEDGKSHKEYAKTDHPSMVEGLTDNIAPPSPGEQAAGAAPQAGLGGAPPASPVMAPGV